MGVSEMQARLIGFTKLLLARSYLLWGCFGGVIVKMAHYGVLREAESGSA